MNGNYTLNVAMDDGVSQESITSLVPIAVQNPVEGMLLELPLAGGLDYVLGPAQLGSPLEFHVSSLWGGHSTLQSVRDWKERDRETDRHTDRHKRGMGVTVCIVTYCFV